MTYPCKRRFDIRSMGQWLYKSPGRPDISDTRQWRETSNFVLNVVAKVVPCEGYATENGWLIDILGASGETVSDYFILVDFASSNLALRKHLMKAFAGCICQLMSIDFLDFVASDNPTRVVYNVNGIGKITSGRQSVCRTCMALPKCKNIKLLHMWFRAYNCKCVTPRADSFCKFPKKNTELVRRLRERVRELVRQRGGPNLRDA